MLGPSGWSAYAANLCPIRFRHMEGHSRPPETYCAMRARPARGFFRRRIMSSGAGPDEGFGHCQVANSNEKKNEAVSVGLQRPPSSLRTSPDHWPL